MHGRENASIAKMKLNENFGKYNYENISLNLNQLNGKWLFIFYFPFLAKNKHIGIYTDHVVIAVLNTCTQCHRSHSRNSTQLNFYVEFSSVQLQRCEQAIRFYQRNAVLVQY